MQSNRKVFCLATDSERTIVRIAWLTLNATHSDSNSVARLPAVNKAAIIVDYHFVRPLSSIGVTALVSATTQMREAFSLVQAPSTGTID